MDIGQILTRLRAEKGIYQKELALYLNVSIGTISNYEKGVHAPDLNTLCKLADYFGVTTDYLLERTKYRYQPETLSQEIGPNFTLEDMVNTTAALSPTDAEAMLDYLDLLKKRDLPG